jgi:hypothetical protein
MDLSSEPLLTFDLLRPIVSSYVGMQLDSVVVDLSYEIADLCLGRLQDACDKRYG